MVLSNIQLANKLAEYRSLLQESYTEERINMVAAGSTTVEDLDQGYAEINLVLVESVRRLRDSTAPEPIEGGTVEICPTCKRSL